MKAVLIISHGSHSAKTKEEVAFLVNQLQKRSEIPIVEYAFLEIEKPSIPEGIDQCVKKGAKEILVTLNFLNSGRHVNDDIPRIVSEAQKKYSDVKIRITPPVGQHPRIIELFLDLINEK